MEIGLYYFEERKKIWANTEFLFKEKLSYDHLRVFRCLCYVYVKLKPNDKFAARSKKCVFIGYVSKKKRL
ncbi:Uncharacterized protein TCM_040820 [Theobroma cacao]|uniref:Retroviral polymerase SH3-like domain-containing protein n=1 Tax=Theobroma cacao TaxID=3641 RepID=A0A061GSI8_THECC|nr:Uncharacterized protein TCM_040820 [Theobroma cacao]